MSVLDTILTDAEKAKPYLEPILATLAVVASATGIGGPVAVQAVALIRAAMQSLEHATAGAVPMERITADIKALGDSLARQDAAADAALDAKFPR
jgi:hypothetical protein